MNIKSSQIPKTGNVPVQGTWLLVQGGEEHLKRTLSERLRKQLLADDDEFNCEQLDVGDRWEGVSETAEAAKRERQPLRCDRILALACELPFLGDGRLVVVRGIDLLPNDQQKKMAAAAATVPASNHLILITSAGENGKATKVAVDLQKAAEKHGVVYDCTPLTDAEAGEWVAETLHDWGQTIEPGALHLLLTRAGVELRRLQIEVDKLSLLVGERKKITLKDVELITPKLAEESVFRLTDAVASGDSATAMAVFRDLIEGQLESPHRIFPLLVRQFRMIWQTKVMLDHGWKPRGATASYPQAVALLPDTNMLGQIGGFMGSKLAGPARNMSWDQLTHAYTMLLECDMAGKAVEGVPRQDMELGLEMLVAKLCVKPGRR